MTAPSGTVQEQLLAEVRATRAWDCIRRQLDNEGMPAALFTGTHRLKETSDHRGAHDCPRTPSAAAKLAQTKLRYKYGFKGRRASLVRRDIRAFIG